MDKMEVEILEDGTIKIETDKISMVNHSTAEAFMRNVATSAGGQQTRKHKQGLIGAVRHAVNHALNRPHGH